MYFFFFLTVLLFSPWAHTDLPALNAGGERYGQPSLACSLHCKGKHPSWKDYIENSVSANKKSGCLPGRSSLECGLPQEVGDDGHCSQATLLLSRGTWSCTPPEKPISARLSLAPLLYHKPAIEKSLYLLYQKLIMESKQAKTSRHRLKVSMYFHFYKILFEL